MCTMRSFPYLIDHCIEWARAKFFDVFVHPSRVLTEFATNPDKAAQSYKAKMKNELPELLTQAPFLIAYLQLLEHHTLKEYITLAIWLYQEFFDT